MSNLHGEAHVLQHISLGQQVKLLKDHSHGLSCQTLFLFLHGGKIFSLKDYPAGGRFLQIVDTAHQGTLSCSGKTDDTKNLSPADFQIDVI